jgi:hypothetical protein
LRLGRRGNSCISLFLGGAIAGRAAGSGIGCRNSYSLRRFSYAQIFRNRCEVPPRNPGDLARRQPFRGQHLCGRLAIRPAHHGVKRRTAMVIRTTTLMRRVEADLHAAFPDVQFRISVPEWSTRRRNRRCIDIFWCGDPPETAVAVVIGKYDKRPYPLFLDHHEPCERCGRPTYPILDGRALCVSCEPDLWGCGSEEGEVRAKQRLKAEAAD